MGLIPQEDIDKVLEANDIVQIVGEAVPDLKQRSGRFLACCPFHKEKTPSFTVTPNEQFYHCFGCGEGGNVVSFVMKFYDMTFPEAMDFLAEKANIQLRKTGGNTYSKSEKGRLTEACKLAAEFYHNQLMRVKSAGSNAARKYLGSRGMGSDVAKRWQLGFAPGNNELVKYLLDKKFSVKELIAANLAIDCQGRACDRFFNRIMFPICDAQGNVIAFGGRVMDDSQPKYLNSSENALFHKSKVMFGLDKAKQNMTATGTAIVVEGYTDVIAMHEAGINFAVATLGTALTRQHIRLLNQHAKSKIVYLFDGDEAGQRAAERALNFIDQMETPEVYKKRAELVALTLPDNMDPKEFIDSRGKDELIKLIANAKPLLQYGIERKLAQYDMSKPGNKARAASAALKILAPIKDSLVAKEYVAEISSKTGMRIEDLMPELEKMKAPRQYDEGEYTEAQDAQSDETPQEHNKISALENELLCVFAKHPEVIKDALAGVSDFAWSNDSHKKIYEFMCEAIAENPKMKSQELLMRIHQKNAQTANMLTRISGMFDLKGNPKNHVKYLVCMHESEASCVRERELRQKVNALENEEEKDKMYNEIFALQKRAREFRSAAKELV